MLALNSNYLNISEWILSAQIGFLVDVVQLVVGCGLQASYFEFLSDVVEGLALFLLLLLKIVTRTEIIELFPLISKEE